MKYIIVSCFLLFASCSNTIQKLRLQKSPEKAPIHTVEFKELDLNSDGSVDEDEFNLIQTTNDVEIKKPVLAASVIILVVFLILYLIKLSKAKPWKS